MAIPVYQVTVPEYALTTFEQTAEKRSYAGTPWFNIEIPAVYWEHKPDFERIGLKIDKCLKRHFLVQKVAIRVLGSEEHEGKSIEIFMQHIKI